MDSLEKRKSNLKKKIFGLAKNNYNKILIAVLVIAFLVRFWVFLKTKDQAIWWDAADYLATAKRWAGINPNLIDMWYYRRGFFWPLFSMFFFLFRLGETEIRFSIVLFSTGIVAVSYFLIKEMFSKKLALLTCVGLTFSWIFLFFSGRPLTNLPATFFLLIAILFFWKGYILKGNKKNFYFFGLFFALACLTRMQYLMFSIPLLVLMVLKEKLRFFTNKKIWISIGIFLLIFMPQIIIHWQHFGNPLLDLSTYYLGISGSESGEVGVKLVKISDLFVYFKNLPYILDGNQQGYSSLFSLSPIYLLFLGGFFGFFYDMFLGLDKIFKNKKIQKKFFIFIWIISTFMFLGYIAPHLEQRYMMQTLPFLFLIAVYPLTKLGDYVHSKFKVDRKVILFTSILILVLLLIPNLKFGNSLIEGKKTSYYEVKQAGLWIKEHSNPEDIIVSASLPQNTYYSERSTYPFRLAYRRDLPIGNETDFEAFVEFKKPRYLILSIFEQNPDWTFQYPEKHPGLLVPVQAYQQGEQAVLVIYEFNYSNVSSI
ncbi:MAG: glycosyltransferase family 39 protein [Nanoarchaeota archaeon]|nr:glycosyltransferase family 39 protein [Nanoarchaeota archaeon]MBU1028271.1 glycosyltransferase family 39 protein [Nanoarchaeota archaeon]